ncbi:hypothetical protein NIES1031_20610 [Chroogloeocystis siderophila 5.2 s.c.1]|uniref:Uncharacterized protein n=1 Tax=Chroogloeocystis siderophila 5.2 s.c.1 TaxID=247279 RepID=A0A1U7HES9_9CHRO|nr:hypothetical protein NIES1031_20610 [Chroogloeocystis siderophila 5.2 s.c.1]
MIHSAFILDRLGGKPQPIFFCTFQQYGRGAEEKWYETLFREITRSFDNVLTLLNRAIQRRFFETLLVLILDIFTKFLEKTLIVHAFFTVSSITSALV